MNQSDLIKKFISIAKKGWIKSVKENHGGVGMTFENELGKKPDADFFPDYNGIEIKCTTRFSDYPLFLLSIAFDGPSDDETDRICQKFGYYDKDYPNMKVIFAKTSCPYMIMQRNGYKTKLNIDEINEKINFEVYSTKDELLDNKSFLNFTSLYGHLMVKLGKIAVIHASKKIFEGQMYFRYYRIDIYELKSFNAFIDLLKSGKIDVTLVARISKSGPRIGQYRNQNLVFELEKSYINDLFNLVTTYDYDKNSRKS